MILPDADIAYRANRQTLVSPFKQANLQPASLDLTLDRVFLHPQRGPAIDLADVKGTVLDEDYYRVETDDYYFLAPQAFVLASTVETVKLPASIVGRVEGKSSLGRLGLLIHSTAGFIDPGFEGKITLELYNLGPRSIKLRPGLRICQISFTLLIMPAQKPYGHKDLNSKYQGQQEATASLYEG